MFQEIKQSLSEQTWKDHLVYAFLMSIMFYIGYRNTVEEPYVKYVPGNCIITTYSIYPIVYRVGHTITVEVGEDKYANIDLEKEDIKTLFMTEVDSPQYNLEQRANFLVSKEVPMSKLK